MTYTADLHIHSSYAYATSPSLNFENLAHWARLKGIDLLASADFTQPEWFVESKAKLSETGDGLYEYDGVKFVLGTEVNCTARVGGRARRVHILVFAPTLSSVSKINDALKRRGAKLDGDGRPTLTMSPRDLLEMILEIEPRCMMIPAHAWTPWFGIFGSKSGFDSLEECFGDLTPHIHAIETGLSSDPAMCWRVPELDDVSIVSFSDAHSLPKLARELTVFNGSPSYDGLAEALRTQDIAYTVEFFPEEGKYHHSGHRRCGVSLTTDEVNEHGNACPVCKRPVTLGVMQRVEDLARRKHDIHIRRDQNGLVRSLKDRPPYRSLVSLQEILSEAMGVGVNTKRVQGAYMSLVENLGSELDVLLSIPSGEAAATLPRFGWIVADGLERVRAGDIHVIPGFDGQYGTVKVWPEDSQTRAYHETPRLL
jgi:uncharacterized protein (TIGR00375 family)